MRGSKVPKLCQWPAKSIATRMRDTLPSLDQRRRCTELGGLKGWLQTCDVCVTYRPIVIVSTKALRSRRPMPASTVGRRLRCSGGSWEGRSPRGPLPCERREARIPGLRYSNRGPRGFLSVHARGSVRASCSFPTSAQHLHCCVSIEVECGTVHVSPDWSPGRSSSGSNGTIALSSSRMPGRSAEMTPSLTRRSIEPPLRFGSGRRTRLGTSVRDRRSLCNRAEATCRYHALL